LPPESTDGFVFHTMWSYQANITKTSEGIYSLIWDVTGGKAKETEFQMWYYYSASNYQLIHRSNINISVNSEVGGTFYIGDSVYTECKLVRAISSDLTSGQLLVNVSNNSQSASTSMIINVSVII
jgi:hypothetical protein